MTLESITFAVLFLSIVLNIVIVSDVRRQRRLRMDAMNRAEGK